MSERSTSRINRRKFIGTSAAGALLALGGATFASRSSAQQRNRPNVLFILADDLGWGDLSIYGEPNFQTPNLDRLARQGTRLINAYAGQTVCTPTRVSFFTGRYPGRLEIGLREPLGYVSQVGTSVGLPPEQPTIASLLKASGYDTGLVGKWHCGYQPKYGPTLSGYNSYYGNYGPAADYFRHVDSNRVPDLWQNVTPIQQAGYLTDLYTQAAVDFINQKRTQPFYLSLHYNASHWPWEGTSDKAVSDALAAGNVPEDWLSGGTPESYASMVKSLDSGIGKVLAALEDAGLADNTLVIFASDNGGEKFSYFGPFRGKKGDLLEGGIRVPTIVRWPGVVPANQISNQVAITFDWTATILAATLTQPSSSYPLDGQNLLPVLTKQQAVYPRTLFWRFGGNTAPQKAVRSGDWKYLLRGGREYLYNLATDKNEQLDLKAQHPKVFSQLQAEYQQWEAQMLPYTA